MIESLPVTLELFAIAEELAKHEEFVGVKTIYDFEVALERLFDNEEECAEEAEHEREKAEAQGRTDFDARVVRLRIAIEEVRDGPNDYEL